MFGMDIALLVGGAIITESVFNIQGLGWMAIDSTFNQDLPTVVGVVMLGAVAVVVMNLIVDIALRISRPASPVRVREVVLEVRDLSVVFPTHEGDVRAVSGLNYTLHRGETLGIVGESGSGKTVSSLALMGLLNTQNARRSPGKPNSAGETCSTLPPDEMRDLRGKDIAMIFQDPFASLHPMHRVGDQIAEAVLAHSKVSKEEAGKQAVALLRRGRHTAAGRAGARLRAPVLRGHAPTRDDRDGARAQAVGADRR